MSSSNPHDIPPSGLSQSLTADSSAHASQSQHDSDVAFRHWQLPDVTQAPDESASNLFGYKPKPQLTPETVEEVAPPTMAEIEDIRAQAEEEGFNEGKQQGLSRGLEQGRLEGLAQGHQEGFSQGQEQGFAAGLAEAKTLVERFDNLVKQFESPLALLDGDIELALLNLTMTLAKSVIGHELITHPEHILSALRLGIDSLPIKEQAVNIRLHPDDAALIEQLYTRAQLARSQWTLEVDPSLHAGDCIITSQRSKVDLSVATRIDAVFADLRQQHAHASLLQQQRKDALEGENTAKIVTADTHNSVAEPSNAAPHGEPDATPPAATAQ
ncbi:flagellar assembly protein FliH [Shewanella sp.]|uniref:flagellar assembly protein FliH n=1 Tax=Shewanella sp. TaxID=50422 RepID=UPI003F3A0D83